LIPHTPKLESVWKIKGRGCADGQRESMSKDESSSPMVAIEALMSSCTIDALEEQDVGNIHIPEAFMQADMVGNIHMKMEAKLAELMFKLDPKIYHIYLQNENGRSVMNVKPKKSLYGTLQAAKLFWKNLTAKLNSWGFTINPYDWCGAN